MTGSLRFESRRQLGKTLYCADAAVAALTGNLDPSVLAAMDKDALKKQIENMKYQATMERWPLSKSIAATYGTIRHLEVEGRLFPWKFKLYRIGQFLVGFGEPVECVRSSTYHVLEGSEGRLKARQFLPWPALLRNMLQGEPTEQLGGSGA
uniref:Uncharacterized protein n=1 Tax=Timema genevievae TaxID=629358 RepID=A0A7R9PPK0_TIMGE|nr:unnamed protein product [Timema genevievae]